MQWVCHVYTSTLHTFIVHTSTQDVIGVGGTGSAGHTRLQGVIGSFKFSTEMFQNLKVICVGVAWIAHIFCQFCIQSHALLLLVIQAVEGYMYIFISIDPSCVKLRNVMSSKRCEQRVHMYCCGCLPLSYMWLGCVDAKDVLSNSSATCTCRRVYCIHQIAGIVDITVVH